MRGTSMRQKRLKWGWLGTALLLATALHAETADCWNQKPAEYATRSLEARSQLQKINVGNARDSIGKPARLGLTETKDLLTAAVDAAVACEASNSKLNASEFEKKLGTLLGANNLNLHDELPTTYKSYYNEQETNTDHVYGTRLRLTAERAAATPTLLTVDFSFSILCGDDSVLLVYAWQDGRWQRLMRYQAPDDYKSPSEAYGDFLTHTIVGHADGAWTLAVAHGMPRCDSRIGNFQLDLLQPQAGSTPRAVFGYESDYSRLEQIPSMRRIEDDGFELQLERNSWDEQLPTYAGLFRYRVHNTQVKRVQPVANNWMGFVQEWLVSDWEESSTWSAPAKLEALHRTYLRLRRAMEASVVPTAHFAAARSCGETSRRVQVELRLSPGSSTFFAVQQNDGGSYTMLEAGEYGDSRCKGPDQLPKASATK